MTSGFEPQPPAEPSWRKPVGTIIMLIFILLWCGIFVTLFDYMSDWNFWLQLPIYIIVGVAWIYPMKPLLLWMNTGKFGHDPVSDNGASDET